MSHGQGGEAGKVGLSVIKNEVEIFSEYQYFSSCATIFVVDKGAFVAYSEISVGWMDLLFLVCRGVDRE